MAAFRVFHYTRAHLFRPLPLIHINPITESLPLLACILPALAAIVASTTGPHGKNGWIREETLSLDPTKL